MSEKSANNAVDIRMLSKENLSQKPFPGGQNAKFRVFLSEAVHADIAKHANETHEVEICGVMVGELCKDERGPFVSVLHSIRGDAAESKMAEVTFTHNTWSKINAEMDSKYPKLSIVGWYHSHPDFGIFLSDRDQFIQEHFFNGPGQIAYVVDPVRKTEGVFIWSDGKPTLTRSYWVGDELTLSTGVGEESKPRRSQMSREPEIENRTPIVMAQAVPAGESFFSAQNLLWIACLALVFIMGYMMASMRSNWEQSRLMEGVIAHFARFNILRPHLREVFDLVNTEVRATAKQMEELKRDHLTRAGEEGKAFAEKWESAEKKLALLADQIPQWQNFYCLSPEQEREVVRHVNQTLNSIKNLPKDFGDASKSVIAVPESTKTPAGNKMDGKKGVAPVKQEGTNATPANKKEQAEPKASAKDKKE